MKFNRIIRVVIDDTEIEYLDTSFNVEKTETGATAKVSIYNLHPSTVNRFASSKNPIVSIYAGHTDENGAEHLYTGDIIYTDNVKNVFSLESASGSFTKKNSTFSKSYKPGVNPKTILKDIVDSFKDITNKKIVDDSDVKKPSYTGGFSFNGLSRVALDNVTKSLGLKWSIQDNTIRVYPIGKDDKKDVLLLDSTSGLIGSPKKVRDSTETGLKNGIEIECILVPGVLPGNKIKLVSREYNTFCVVSSLTHAGSYHENDFLTRIKAVTI